MKEVTLISGKGGTGKTSLAGAFAALAGKSVLADCDVDAANLSLVLQPELEEEHLFKASRKAFIHEEYCNGCGLCRELCRFGAVSEDLQVDNLSCEGCGVCYYACPEEAISYDEVVSGRWYKSSTPYGPLIHARLGVAEENSGRLVTLLRQKAREIAESTGDFIINDGPPGIGCPVIASLGGASAALIVTEPTLSGIHDLERVLSVCSHFQVSPFVCINRSDLDEENTARIKDYCQKHTIPLAGEIPFDRAFVEAVVNRLPVVEYGDNSVTRSVSGVWDFIMNKVFE